MSAEQQRTIGLHSVAAVRREITEPVRLPGVIAFDEAHVAVLRPLVQARLTRLLVRPGDPVAKGQMLAELDVPSLTDAQDNLAAAVARVREAEAGVTVARDALRRGEILAADGALPTAEAGRRRAELLRMRADADAARAHLASLRAAIARLNPHGGVGKAALVSPMKGIVATVGARLGEVLDAGTAALMVADLSVVQAEVPLPESRAGLVRAGDAATVRLADGDRTWTGRVAALGALLDTQTRTLPARIALANPGSGLRAGMAVDVTLTTDRGRTGVVVPASAVQTVKDAHVAFTRAQDGSFQRHDLTLGVQGQDWVEVRDGLQAGDDVVTDGSFALKAQMQQDMLGGAG